MRYIDLTRTVTDGMPVFPGDPPVRLVAAASVAVDGFADHQITAGMHAGTHLDAPAHMLSGAGGIADLPASAFFGRGCLIDARGHAAAGPELLDRACAGPGDIVLVLTGHANCFGSPAYYADYPEISARFAEALVARGVKMLGFDAPSPDRAPYPVHKRLLSQGVLILENLVNLEALIGVTAFDVVALPAKYAADAAPVRAVAVVAD